MEPGLYLTGGQGSLTPARGNWPPESSAELLWGSTLTSLRTPDSIFLLNQYIYVQLYAAYASIETDVIYFSKLFQGTNLATNLHAHYSRSVSHSQSKLWPPSENLTYTALYGTTSSFGLASNCLSHLPRHCKNDLIIALFASRRCGNCCNQHQYRVAVYRPEGTDMRRRDLHTSFVRFPNNDGFVAGLVVSHIVCGCRCQPVLSQLFTAASNVAQRTHLLSIKCIPEVRP